MKTTATSDKRTFFQKWFQGQLRRLWSRYPSRNTAKALARVSRGKYRCAECGEESFGPKQIHVDHTSPVIDPEVGFVDWNTYIERLFVPHQELRVLCIPCHKAVTKAQNEVRRASKKKDSK